MTDWTLRTSQDQPYAMTRFGAHRFVEHLLDNHQGTELAGTYAGCQNYVVKDGKCYVAFGGGPNASTQSSDPSRQGIFEFDGAKVTRTQEFAPGTVSSYGVCLDKDGNFAYDDDGWANLGTAGAAVNYTAPSNLWPGNGYATPRLIGSEVVFANVELGLNVNAVFDGGAGWLVKDTREVVIARTGAWPPVLERFDASIDLGAATMLHSLGDLRQDPQGQIWGVVLRNVDGQPVTSNTDHINPNNYVAVVKVPAGLVGECEVWWDASGQDIPWPYHGALELEMADPDYMVACLSRHHYGNPAETSPPATNPGGGSASSWASARHQFWRIDKHDKTKHVIEADGYDAGVSGGTLRFQDVVIADTYYGTLWVRYPDGTWHEERADAGDETYLRSGDPAVPDLYGAIDYSAHSTAALVPSYLDYIRIGPTNGTDLYALIQYTQNAYNGGQSGGDWVRWTPNLGPQPALLTGAIGPARYII